jgi:hypothetical protein
MQSKVVVPSLNPRDDKPAQMEPKSPSDPLPIDSHREPESDPCGTKNLHELHGKREISTSLLSTQPVEAFLSTSIRAAPVRDTDASHAHTTRPEPDRDPMAGGEFGDIDFSMEDLALIDSMVQHATQSDSDSGDNKVHLTVSASRRDTIASSSRKAEHHASTPDPFGDFPDIDFEMLDKTIADHEQQGQPKVRNHGPPARGHSSDPSNHTTGFLQFTRYRVVHVMDDASRFIKTVSVQIWEPDTTEEFPAVGGPCARDWLRFLTPATPANVVDLRPTHGEIQLCGDWYFTPLSETDVIHVCSLSGRFNTDVQIAHRVILDTNFYDDLLLIVHPDILLTPTTVSETVTCSRRAVLKNRLGSSGLSCKLVSA